MTKLLDMLDADQLADLDVIGWGCPVPFFGHVESASIATVGINPSNREFVGTDGNELSDRARRLPTLSSLDLPTWSQADFNSLRTILSACREYFERNPYDGWFRCLDRLIEPTGHSYYSPRSNACHLDIVPWATSSKWGTLSSNARKQLVERTAIVLAWLIASSSLTMLVLNGQEVVRQFEALLGHSMDFQRVRDWDLPRQSGRSVPGLAYRLRLNTLAQIPLDRELLVLGYNHNLQSSFGVTAAVHNRISEWICAQHRGFRW